MMIRLQDIRRGVRRGDGGMHASSPVQVIYEELFSIYDEFQKQLEPSAYVGQDEQGRRIRKFFPQTNKIDVFNVLRERFREVVMYQFKHKKRISDQI